MKEYQLSISAKSIFFPISTFDHISSAQRQNVGSKETIITLVLDSEKPEYKIRNLSQSLMMT